MMCFFYPRRERTPVTPFGHGSERWPWPKQPHTCPVCKGKGQVPPGFYQVGVGTGSSSAASVESCRTCQGNGIVWQP